jgi:hypothetical protein
MRLPNVENAQVQREKLVGYLLASGHTVGGSKATFLARFGFTQENWPALQRALLQHASAHEVAASQVSDHGQFFEIVGPLSTPDGRNPTIRSVWLIDSGSSSPRLITIVPSHRSSRVAGT